MWDTLLGSIRQMGVFMICAQTLIYFKPKGSYEKYLKLLVGAMILVQLLGPIQVFLAGDGGQSLEERIAFYNDSLEQSLGAVPEEYRLEQIRRQLLTIQLETWPELGNADISADTSTDVSAFPRTEDAPAESGIYIEPIAPVTVEALQRGEDGGEDGGEDQGETGR